MIYIASPYTHDDEVVRRVRFARVQNYARKCMAKGELVFSPIVYGHGFVDGANTDLIPFTFWQPFNEEMILRCDVLRVLKLPGWKASIGVAAEMAYAESNGIEILLVEPNHENI